MNITTFYVKNKIKTNISPWCAMLKARIYMKSVLSDVSFCASYLNIYIRFFIITISFDTRFLIVYLFMRNYIDRAISIRVNEPTNRIWDNL